VSNAPTLHEKLNRPSQLVKLAGAHDVMGARLAAAAGFEGVWASSLEIATSHGVPDSNLLTWRQLHAVAAEIARSVAAPVVADCQTGFGGPEIVREVALAYEGAGIAAICLEDGADPPRNSLLPGQQAVAPCGEFAKKVAAAASVRKRLLVLARVQSLVAGHSQQVAQARAHAYVAAGADAIVIHSRSPDPDQVIEFIAAWDRDTPLVLIPTTYHSLTVAQMLATGKVGMVIYANHGLRAAIAGMKRVFCQILDEGTSHGVESWIAGLPEAFALQSPRPA
jgi:phosphoenolpyruvate phosphomutase